MLLAIFALAALAAFITDAFSLGMRAVNQFIMLSALTACVFVAVRYILADFIYKTDDDGEYLEIIRVTSRLPQTNASVKISPADKIVRLTGSKEALKDVQKKMYFNLSFMPEELYAYIFTYEGVRQALILECDGRYAEYIESLIQRSKEQRNGNSV